VAAWTILGAPLDSAGAGEGEELAPAALRDAGVARAVGAVADLGDVTEPLRPAERDPATGVVAYEAVVRASRAVRDAVGEVVRSGGRPLVLGGDCTLLPGALAGCRVAGVAPGLWMVDGHPDALDGTTSPTGEAADMDLAVVCGRGPRELTALAGDDAVPLVAPERCAVLGLRPPGTDPGGDDDLAQLDGRVWRRFAPALVAEPGGPAIAGLEAAALLGGGPAWLHLDLDVLDAAVLPAVSYPQPLGLDWTQLEELLVPLAGAPGLVGCSVSDLRADLDPDGAHAERVVALLGRLLG